MPWVPASYNLCYKFSYKIMTVFNILFLFLSAAFFDLYK